MEDDELDGSDFLPSPVANDITIIVIDDLKVKMNMNDHKFEDKGYDSWSTGLNQIWTDSGCNLVDGGGNWGYVGTASGWTSGDDSRKGLESS
ncbi:hypothetical protein E3N88_22902 [Mikania micrantha]|uniref:Uncharacterized protein n=1 Tax=Mikania micrantha TaxID=192012 RepID=A0A5N6NBS0_9ASTR|nr:hypothetical protein E3N88_22902 [Mikania micrantha]